MSARLIKGTWHLLLLSLLCFSSSAMALPSQTAADVSSFKQANDFYRSGKFEEAAKIYQELAEGHPTGVFYYNLGNTRFRMNQSGPAIFAYERAMRLEPRNPDIRRNLNYVRGLLEYRIQDKRNWYVRAGENVLEYFTVREINLLWVMTVFFFLAVWASRLWTGREGPWGWRRKTLLALAFVFIGLAILKNIETNVMSDAIVMKGEVEVRYGPSESDQVAFRLGEGLKVYVVDRRENWKRIVLVNGESGWVSSEDIAEVRL